jgi:hypothetical protein
MSACSNCGRKLRDNIHNNLGICPECRFVDKYPLLSAYIIHIDMADTMKSIVEYRKTEEKIISFDSFEISLINKIITEEEIEISEKALKKLNFDTNSSYSEFSKFYYEKIEGEKTDKDIVTLYKMFNKICF